MMRSGMVWSGWVRYSVDSFKELKKWPAECKGRDGGNVAKKSGSEMVENASGVATPSV